MVELKAVKGLQELRMAMLELPKKMDRKTLNAALLPGANIIRDEARRLAPTLKPSKPTKNKPNPGLDPRRHPGAIKHGIVSNAYKPIEHTATVVVRVRTRGYIFYPDRGIRSIDRLKNSSLRGNPNYWWLVEFGTSKAPAQPFMRPAFERKKQEALDMMVRALSKRIDQEAEKLGRMRK